jgi:hypothetical protein
MAEFTKKVRAVLNVASQNIGYIYIYMFFNCRIDLRAKCMKNKRKSEQVKLLCIKKRVLRRDNLQFNVVVENFLD